MTPLTDAEALAEARFRSQGPHNHLETALEGPKGKIAGVGPAGYWMWPSAGDPAFHGQARAWDPFALVEASAAVDPTSRSRALSCFGTEDQIRSQDQPREQ